jgi:hypothetical protein
MFMIIAIEIIATFAIVVVALATMINDVLLIIVESFSLHDARYVLSITEPACRIVSWVNHLQEVVEGSSQRIRAYDGF